jgi:hypothetical protein
MRLWNKLVSLLFGSPPKVVEIEVRGRKVRGKMFEVKRGDRHLVSYHDPIDGHVCNKWLTTNEFTLVEGAN